MTLLDLTHAHTPAARPSLFAFAQQAAALHRQRAALRRLTDEALTDLGIGRDAAQREAARPFWDIPASWRR